MFVISSLLLKSADTVKCFNFLEQGEYVGNERTDLNEANTCWQQRKLSPCSKALKHEVNVLSH